MRKPDEIALAQYVLERTYDTHDPDRIVLPPGLAVVGTIEFVSSDWKADVLKWESPETDDVTVWVFRDDSAPPPLGASTERVILTVGDVVEFDIRLRNRGLLPCMFVTVRYNLAGEPVENARQRLFAAWIGRGQGLWSTSSVR